MTTTYSHRAFFNDLAALLTGQLFLPEDVAYEQVRWAQHISQALAPYALKGGYINLLDEQEQERVPLAFGSNYERLLDLKRKYDPDDVFRSTIGHLVPKEVS